MVNNLAFTLGCPDNLFTCRIIGPGGAESVERAGIDGDLVNLACAQLIHQLCVVWCQLVAPFRLTGLP